MNFSSFTRNLRFLENPELSRYQFNPNKRSFWSFVSYGGEEYFLKVMLKLDDTLYREAVEANKAITTGANIRTIPTEFLKLATFIHDYEILTSYLGDSAKTETEHMRVLSSTCPGLTPIFAGSNIDQDGNVSDMDMSKTVCKQMIDQCIPRTSSSSASGGGGGEGSDPNAFLTYLLTNGSIVPIIYVTEVFGQMIDSPAEHVEPMLELLLKLHKCTRGGLLTDPNSQQFLIKKGQRGDQFEGDSYVPDEYRVCDIDELIFPEDETEANNTLELLQLYKTYVLKIYRFDNDGNIGFIQTMTPGENILKDVVNAEFKNACSNPYIYGWLVQAIFKREQEQKRQQRYLREKGEKMKKQRQLREDVDRENRLKNRPVTGTLGNQTVAPAPHCCRLGSYCPFGNYCLFSGGKYRRNKSRRNKSRRNKSRRNKSRRKTKF
jgi:hypothetical protein